MSTKYTQICKKMQKHAKKKPLFDTFVKRRRNYFLFIGDFVDFYNIFCEFFV